MEMQNFEETKQKKVKVYPYSLEIRFDPQCDEDGGEDYYTQVEAITAYGTDLRDAIDKASSYAEEQFGPRDKRNSTLVYWSIQLGQGYEGDKEPKVIR